MSNCKKPNCDCLEQQAKKDGVSVYEVKGGYQCLYADTGDMEVMKSASSQQPKEQEKEKNLPPLIQKLADAIEAKGLKVTFGLQPEHFELIEAGLKEGIFTNEYLFEKIAKQIGWEKYTLACWYIKHLCKQTTIKDTRISELEARVKKLEEALREIEKVAKFRLGLSDTANEVHEIATNALKTL